MKVKYYDIIEYWIIGCYNHWMWCGYQKLGNCFYLTVFMDSSLMQWFYFRNDLKLGLWMVSFRSLLTFLWQHVLAVGNWCIYSLNVNNLIIIFINCNWVVTQWQWLFYMYTSMEKKVTRKFKSGGLHEKHVVATWKLGNHLSFRL